MLAPGLIETVVAQTYSECAVKATIRFYRRLGCVSNGATALPATRPDRGDRRGVAPPRRPHDQRRQP
jgi:hypothetical protein